MELLTLDEYQALAENLDFAATAYIDGAHRPAISGKTFATTNPVLAS